MASWRRDRCASRYSRALVLTQPANAHEHIIAIRGTGRRQALAQQRVDACASPDTSRESTARSRGNGEEAIERLHGLIPSQVVPHHQEVTAMEAGQQFRVINDALFAYNRFGFSWALLASVCPRWYGLREDSFAHDNPISPHRVTFTLLRFEAYSTSSSCEPTPQTLIVCRKTSCPSMMRFTCYLTPLCSIKIPVA